MKKVVATAFALALGAACAGVPMSIDQAAGGPSISCAPIGCKSEGDCKTKRLPSEAVPPNVCVEEVERPWYRFGDASRVTLKEISDQFRCVRVLQDDARQFADHDLGYDDSVSKLNRRQLELEPASGSISFLVAASTLDATEVKQALGNLVNGTGSPLEIRLFHRSCSELCAGSRATMTVRFVPDGKTSVDLHEPEADDCALVSQRAQEPDAGAPASTASAAPSASAATPGPSAGVPSAPPPASASAAPPAPSASAPSPAPAPSSSAARPR